MKQRITFLQRPEDSIDPARLTVTEHSISTETVVAAREDSVTFSFEELPQEFLTLLEEVIDYHIRWTSETSYDVMPPLVGRTSPGLHAFYTPREASSNETLSCEILTQSFGTSNCVSSKVFHNRPSASSMDTLTIWKEAFTRLPTTQGTDLEAVQYYSRLPSLSFFTKHFIKTICAKATNKRTCLQRLIAIKDASTISIDSTSSSRELTIKAYWPSQEWVDLSVIRDNPSGGERVEVGFLTVSNTTEPDQVKLGGFVTVLGERKTPAPVLFSFASRHQEISSSFTSKFLQPTGLHPTLEINISNLVHPANHEERECRLYTHLTLPKEVFVDKYQISDALFMASKNLTKIEHITIPVDLEAPAYAVKSWGSSLLLSLAAPVPRAKEDGSSEESTTEQVTVDEAFSAQIPMHLRYLAPNSNLNGMENTTIPFPIIFWACNPDPANLLKVADSPFDSTALGYDGFFDDGTIFYHISPQVENVGNTLISSLSVPVLDLNGSKWVELGTGLAVLVGFGWVFWCLLQVLWADWFGKGGQAKKNKVQETKDEVKKLQ